MTTIKVFEITGRNAISMQKGDLIYKTLEQNFKNKEKPSRKILLYTFLFNALLLILYTLIYYIFASMYM